MHTAICTFEDRAAADRAVESLLQSGFDRADVHLEYLHADGTPVREGQAPLMHGEPATPGQANDNWDGLEREVAMDPGRLHRLGQFFQRLFGHDEGAAMHAGRYSGAMDKGHCVVFVDANSDEQAERAQSILHGMNPDDLNLFQRGGQRPLRDVVAERQAEGGSLEQRFGTARGEMGAEHNMDMREEGEFPRERERAMASQGWGEQRKLDLVDEDKPIASPDIPAAHESDKPR
ncbi:MAG TPA: hypothetical protein VEB23_06025, partial [Ramlibacter sp.]|nr:hypothetical protein [Ramlibacter sp.]